jgi:hypothetical protein
VPPAKAKTDGEDLARPARAQLRDRGPDVALDSLRGRLLDMRPVLEVISALVDARRPSEVVERDRRDAALGEAQRELLVEPVEPAHVRQDHDARARRRVRLGPEGGEAVPVGRL